MTREEIAAIVSSSPEKQLRLWVVYVEDVYETLYGDGYYSYPERAFRERESAERCADWINRTTSGPHSPGYRAQVADIVVVLNESGQLMVPHPKGKELINWEQMMLPELIAGTHPDWRSLVKAYHDPRASAPEFGP